MKILNKIFKNLKKDKGQIILSTKNVHVISPNYKQVVEHIKGVFLGGKYIELNYKINDEGISFLKAFANDNNKDFDIEYLSKEMDENIYRLQGCDIEQTMCFFRDFLGIHKLVDFDLKNNDWKKI